MPGSAPARVSLTAMKLVLTLLVRDEADIVDANIAFHLNAGVDFVVATDNRSEDGTTEILEAYAREGVLELIREPGDDLREEEWRTRMSRLAATDHAADWVISADGDEFWWPRGGDLKERLAAIPARYGTVGAFVRHFPPRPHDGSFFAERMTFRFSPHAPVNDPASPFRAVPKVMHRAAPEIRVSRGTHEIVGTSLLPLRGWYPFEVLHFPIRSPEQYAHKSGLQVRSFANNPRGIGTAYHANAYRASREGRTMEHYASLALDDAAVTCGLDDGSLTRDTRLRDALRTLRRAEPDPARAFALPAEVASPLAIPRPTVVDDAAYAIDISVLGETDVVRLQRRVDQLEHRVVEIEQRPTSRIRRRIARTLRPRAR